MNSLPKNRHTEPLRSDEKTDPKVNAAMTEVPTNPAASNDSESQPQAATGGESATLSRILSEVFDAKRPTTTVGSLLDELEHHGLAIALIFFSVPAAIPVPAAGYSTVLSIPLFILAYHLLAGKDSLWLPEKIRAKSFSPGDFAKGKALMLKISGIIEMISKPRYSRVVRSRAVSFLLGLVILILAAFMSLPIPGTNTLPAGGIFLIGFGLLEEDGLILLGGVFYSLCAAAFATLVLFVGKELAQQVVIGVLDYF